MYVLLVVLISNSRNRVSELQLARVRAKSKACD